MSFKGLKLWSANPTHKPKESVQRDGAKLSLSEACIVTDISPHAKDFSINGLNPKQG